MICPKCNCKNASTLPRDPDENKGWCPKCNAVWDLPKSDDTIATERKAEILNDVDLDRLRDERGLNGEKGYARAVARLQRQLAVWPAAVEKVRLLSDGLPFASESGPVAKATCDEIIRLAKQEGK